MKKAKLLRFFANVRNEYRKLVDDHYYNTSVLEKRRQEMVNEIMNIADPVKRIEFVKELAKSVKTISSVKLEEEMDLLHTTVRRSEEKGKKLQETLKFIENSV